MSILVVGSIALDTVKTPTGNADDALGGSALFFSTAASFFAPVKVVGVVGEDFDFSGITFLEQRDVDLSGLKVEKGKTFRWGGRYHDNMNKRDTLFTYLNVFEKFQPVIPVKHRKSKFIFLANIDPELQLQVLESVDSPQLVVLDTMNFWINGKRDALEAVIKQSDIVILNDEEVRELTDIYNINTAAQEILKKGPRVLVIKKGEHGAIMVSQDDYFSTVAFPVKSVVDPTGAGDSFAGGFVGYLACCGELTNQSFRKAVAYGTTVASFSVESFSFNRLKEISRSDIEKRLEIFRTMTHF
jgi:sugar/nucleoside kinase (ribokinase family)